MIISYQLLLLLLVPVFAWLSISHAFKNKDRFYLWQRLGMKLPHYQNPTWFHCASVGEIITIIPLITLYNKEFPNKKILVTTNSVTGANICRNRLPFVTHCFLPLDYRFITRRFLSKIKPSQLIIMETELWPNLFQLCHSKSIPLNIINGRLSKRSLDINAWSRSVYKKTLNFVNKIYCRSESDMKAYKILGATDSQIEIIGNLKFAVTLNTNNEPSLIDRPYVLVASTHTGEEKKIAELWNKTDHGNLLLVIAPRHPERKTEILNDITPLSKEIKVRSLQQAITKTTDIYLADTLGELSALFQHAEFVIMGGSFVNKGGHNILEPAALSKAILYGPFMANFAAEDLLFREHNAATQANNDNEAISHLNRLISDTAYRQELGRNAKALIDKNNDIAAVYLEKIRH